MFISAFIRRGFGGRRRETPGVPSTPITYTPPTTPTSLTLVETAQSYITFSWTGSTSTDSLNVLGYKVYRDGTLVAQQPGTTVTVTGLSASTSYSFTVKAYTLQLDSTASSALVTSTLTDSTPDAFTFTPVTGAAISTVTESNQVTITGLSAPGILFATNSAQWSRDGGAWTTGSSTISNGQTLKVRITSSASPLTAVQTNVRVGSSIVAFVVTTGTGDQLPVEFDFTTQTEVALNTQMYSGFETVTGIDVAVPVTVSNGEWAKNGSAVYSSAAGTVVNNDTVAVRHQSSASENTTTTTQLNVGLGALHFSTTTLQNTAPDMTPDAFTIPWAFGLNLNEVYTSGPWPITGINVPVIVTVGAVANCEWDKNASGNWTSSPGTVEDGDDFYIRATASHVYYDARVTGAMIGNTYVPFTLVTAQQNADTTPDPFPFTPQTEVALGSVITSAPVSIAGIDTLVVVTVAGGEWDKNSAGAWSSQLGVVSSGDTVRVRHTSSGSYNTSTNTTLTVGLGQATFTSVTLQDVQPDTTPDAISNQAITGVDVSTVQTFTPVTITGINAAATVSISGSGSPQFSVAGGAYTTSGSVTVGQAITVRVTAPATYGASTAATLLVGGVSATFSVFSSASDTTPDAFTFVNQTGRNPNTVTNSGSISVLGVNSPVSVAVLNGEWQRFLPAPATAFTTAPGSAVLNDSLRVRHTTAATPLTGVTTTLTVGGVSGTFTTTTKADTTAPTTPVLISVNASGADGWQLNWSTSTDEFGVTGYKAYADTGSGPIEFYSGTSQQTTQSGIPPATTTTYTVKAFDAAGNLSASSNAIQVTTAPPVNNNRTGLGVIQVGPFSMAAPGTNTAAGSAFAITAVSASGTPNIVNHNQPITITGAQFGSKSTAAPAVWDRCLGTNLATLWTAYNPVSAAATYNAQYRDVGFRSVTGPHSRATRYITAANTGGSYLLYGGADAKVAKNLGVVPQEGIFYARGYYRTDPSWQFNGNDNDNHKIFIYSVGNTDPAVEPYVYVDYSSGYDSPSDTTAQHKTRALPLANPDINGNDVWWFSGPAPHLGWRLYEYECKRSTGNTGYFRCWEDGVLMINYAGKTDYGSAGQYISCGFGGYSASYSLNSTTNYRYFSDLYFDGTAARVMLCNSSTYTSSTIREPQIPTAWSSTSITCTGNLGKFTSGTAYLFVIDSNGAVSPGYAVTVGS